jgi:hypothetical protein
MTTDGVDVLLSRDQAVVLFEWLARTGRADRPADFDDRAERQVVWELEDILAAALADPLREDYPEVLAAARARIRDGHHSG